MKNAILIPLAMITLLFSCAHEDKNAIGKDGNITEIVLPDGHGKIMEFAANELQQYMKDITGVELHINKASESNKNKRAIYLSIDQDDSLKWDGYRIISDNEGIKISATEPRGILFAVYTLLEDAGCSFFYLKKEEQIVPESDVVEFPYSNKIHNPRIEHRGYAPYGLVAENVELGRDFIDWMAKNRFNYILVSEDRPSDHATSAHASIWKDVQEELLPEVQKRGFVIEMSEHCTHVFFPRSLFKEHPDWFALNDGVRKLGKPPYSGQMCYSNEDAVEYYANAIAEYAVVHPEFHVIGTWPLDGGKYCECESCKDPLTVFKAAMRVAEKVKKVRPDMIVEHLAYKPQTWQPPAGDIPDNMSVLWCPDNGKLDSLAKMWVYKTRNAGGVYQFEYYMGDNYRAWANVWLRPQFAVDLVDHAEKIGFKGIISLFLPMDNWWRSCFNGWFFSKASWDRQFDVNKGLQAYCQNYYGSSSQDVEKIFKTIFTDLNPEPYVYPVSEAYQKRSHEIIQTATSLLNHMDEIIAKNNDPVIDERLQRLRTYIEFFIVYTKSFQGGQMEDLDSMINYSKEHENMRMVLMHPDYIRSRTSIAFE